MTLTNSQIFSASTVLCATSALVCEYMHNEIAYTLDPISRNLTKWGRNAYGLLAINAGVVSLISLIELLK